MCSFFADALSNESGELISTLASEELSNASGDFGTAFLRMCLTLVAIVILLLLSYYVIRKMVQNRFQRGGSTHVIQVIAKRMLSPKTMLYIVEVEGKRFFLVESHLEVRSIAPLSSQISKNLKDTCQ